MSSFKITNMQMTKSLLHYYHLSYLKTSKVCKFLGSDLNIEVTRNLQINHRASNICIWNL